MYSFSSQLNNVENCKFIHKSCYPAKVSLRPLPAEIIFSITQPNRMVSAPDLKPRGQGFKSWCHWLFGLGRGQWCDSVSSVGVEPAVNGYLEKSRGGGHGKRRMIYPDPPLHPSRRHRNRRSVPAQRRPLVSMRQKRITKPMCLTLIRLPLV